MNSKSQKTQNAPNLLTIDELASILRVKRSWIYRQTMKSGPNTIPRLKVGQYLRFDIQKVLNWIEGRG